VNFDVVLGAIVAGEAAVIVTVEARKHRVCGGARFVTGEPAVLVRVATAGAVRNVADDDAVIVLLGGSAHRAQGDDGRT
jgi:hypothetical protein